jgi:D-3-phosphoglycerate dehydrogenase
MELIAYDPYIAEDYARNFQVELVTLDELLKRSDFITFHAPLTKLTKEIIGEKELSLVKPTVRIINTARGGLINEEALVEAIRAKKVGGAAFDVFDTEPIISSILFEEDNIIVTPHLGASTAEAQAMVAEDIAEQIIDVFNGEPARYAVNAPFISAETMSGLSPFIRAAGAAGKLASQLIDGKTSSVQIKYDGEISHYDTNALKVAVLGGLLDQISEERVNLVNANIVAARRGMKIVEQKDTICENYTNLITAEISTGSESVVVATTVIRGETHIVRVNDYWIDIYPCEGYFLFCDHLDRPGLLGSVGKITGDANINISAMHVGRLKPRGQALMILLLDEALPEKHRQQLLALTDMYSTRMVKL